MERDKLRARQLFAAMNKKEKLNYIGRYYWPHMLGAVLLAAVLVSVGLTVYNNAVRSNWLHVGVVAPYTRILQQPLEDAGAQMEESLNYLDLMSVEGEYGADAMTQLSCYLAADQMDIAVCDAPTKEYLVLQDGEENLSIYPLEQTLLADSFEGLELPEVFLVVRHNVSRSDRAEAFARLLVTEPTP